LLRGVATVALLFAALGAGAAPELRTLFHSPEERERLDRLRRGEPNEAGVERRRAPTIGGFVKRSDGRNTVWIDGQPVPMTGAASVPLTDPAKVRDARRPEAPSIEVKRTP